MASIDLSQTSADAKKTYEASVAKVNQAIALDRVDDMSGALQNYNEAIQLLNEVCVATKLEGFLDGHNKLVQRRREVKNRVRYLKNTPSDAALRIPVEQHVTVDGIADLSVEDKNSQVAIDGSADLSASFGCGVGDAFDVMRMATRALASVFTGTAMFAGIALGTLTVATLAVVAALPVGVGYVVSPGFRRICNFWSYMLPLIIDYKELQTRAWFDGCSTDELERRKADFHRRTAPKIFDAIVDMKGVFVKTGQLLSTIGMGVIEDVYVNALKPLQDGLPPRPLQEISAIIEQDVGLQMFELFKHFDPKPVGAASIGQAHRAVLADGRQVIVKVQYPETIDLYAADFDNMETMTRLFQPDLMPMLEQTRKRHENELDFRIEAGHLRKIRANMIAHGFEPRLVRIPEVVEGPLCTKCVLAMEYLEGTSMKSALKAEADKFALALGFASGDDLQAYMIKKHIEHLKSLKSGGDGASDNLPNPDSEMFDRAVAGRLFWLWLRQQCSKFHHKAARFLPTICGQECFQPSKIADTAAPYVDLEEVIKEIIHVHGYQLLVDGMFNVDPHPGNVLLLHDGRIGLIDYGMVGHLTLPEREQVAKVIVALADCREEDALRIFAEAGYTVKWPLGEPPKPNNVLKHLVRLHFDRFDLPPIDAGEENPWLFQDLAERVQEQSVPEFINVSRRLTGLLIGIGIQSGRPVSIVKEWAPLARSLLKSNDSDSK